MPSARSASWPNQGLSGTARHFPGLGILAKMPNSAFSPSLRHQDASQLVSRGEQCRATATDPFHLSRAHLRA
jgi:hypothetical protein